MRKHNLFGLLFTNLITKPVGFKLIITKKQNVQGHVAWYKVHLFAQGFIQWPEVDYDFTYSSVMDSNTFRYLLGIAVQYSLETQLPDALLFKWSLRHCHTYHMTSYWKHHQKTLMDVILASKFKKLFMAWKKPVECGTGTYGCLASPPISAWSNFAVTRNPKR